ncbi:hypothetical protein F441_07539 [Phytophthora nicotianae CJ01A1]|nr:hypothetical protein L915_07387 [Phytophthora nicotianae]ETL41753.1 hypothetical protein L916_07329 [Phytophthora nicotianae]ETL94903.1 hypothetical protein L917_07222 [Phytophthora nicotianae]ETO77194.1 hypothetical protein F444_07577 [Phytophthora nicotianae P1976]ETP18206.1 hypothetical protein F441_07539 [Phytophthora nicotianae CJ01A1]
MSIRSYRLVNGASTPRQSTSWKSTREYYRKNNLYLQVYGKMSDRRRYGQCMTAYVDRNHVRRGSLLIDYQGETYWLTEGVVVWLPLRIGCRECSNAAAFAAGRCLRCGNCGADHLRPSGIESDEGAVFQMRALCTTHHLSLYISYQYY